jgi:hypothetical protein
MAVVRTQDSEVLFERETELDRLRALIAGAAGGHGAAALVEGPAGIGKTSLIAAARRLAGELAVESVVARGGELECDSPMAWCASCSNRVCCALRSRSVTRSELARRIEAELISSARLIAETLPVANERAARVAQPIAGDTPGERMLLAELAHQRLLDGGTAAEAIELATRAVAHGLDVPGGVVRRVVSAEAWRLGADAVDGHLGDVLGVERASCGERGGEDAVEHARRADREGVGQNRVRGSRRPARRRRASGGWRPRRRPGSACRRARHWRPRRVRRRRRAV